METPGVSACAAIRPSWNCRFRSGDGFVAIFTPIFTPTLDVTALYIGHAVSRGVCRALQLYSSRYLYSSTTLYTLQPLHPPSAVWP